MDLGECVDFKNLNKAFPKGSHRQPEFDWNVDFLISFQYKCFLDAYKGYHQILMKVKHEEKIKFHTKKGIFCYKKMPFGLKNARATYQRLIDNTFPRKIRSNNEAYVDDLVIKSKNEEVMINDIEETFKTS